MTDALTGDEGMRRWVMEMWAHEPTMFRVIVEGASIACRGWNLDGDAPGLILVHGFRAHGRWWDHIAPALAGERRVVALDLSGMGDSDRRPDYSRAQFAREIAAVASATGMVRPAIAAHSFGALPSIIACGNDPDGFERLIVLDTAFQPPEAEHSAIPTPPLRTYATREGAIERFRLIPPGAWPQPDILAYVAQHSVQQDADGSWSWKFDNEAAPSLNRENGQLGLGDVSVPADVIYGALSELFTETARAQVPRILPNCGQMIAIPAAHHHVLIEQPIALIAAIRALLANPRR